MTTLVIADDHTSVRHGVRALLEDEPDFAVVGEASNGVEAVVTDEKVLTPKTHQGKKCRVRPESFEDGWHDSNDLMGDSVHSERLTYDSSGVSSEPRLPKTVAQENGGRGIRIFVLPREDPTQGSLDA